MTFIKDVERLAEDYLELGDTSEEIERFIAWLRREEKRLSNLGQALTASDIREWHESMMVEGGEMEDKYGTEIE